ncbi:hypothetical protein MAHJHV47_44470 [Mycobacterium avium subsp. hominissuis]|nr:hypothetical protein L837_4510 [Mycobacterium avium MAV_061107_1842]ETZ45238.1 hypothetical protein L838_3687 [Mycobacterium avium MAV_120709_2344]ETZ49105.1 hypothetical protein L839_3226 [Mycobacterium avium MAV_120809_2495]
MRFIRRARRTKATRDSVDQRRAAASPGGAGVDFARPDDLAVVTYDRVLIS